MKTRPFVVAIIFGIFFLSHLVLSDPIIAGSTSIAAAGDNSFFLKPDGSLWSWGANNNGQLGDGTTVYKTTPVKLSGKW